MSTAINSSLTLQCTVQKQVSPSDPTATPVSLRLDLQIPSQSWNATSTPLTGTEAWSGHVALTAGAATIDMTALTQLGLSGTISASGLKLRSIAALADATNANPISIGTGASNGYTQIGTLSVLNAADSVVRTLLTPTAIDGTHKTLDIAGTGTQGCEILLIFGP